MIYVTVIKTVLSKHSIENEHDINFDEATVLHSEKVKLKREILETIGSKMCAGSMNFTTYIQYFTSIYQQLLNY